METSSILITVGIIAAIPLAFLFFFRFIPIWSVWSSKQQGMADLAKAQFEQQIKITEAQNRLNAADLHKQASIIEAEAVAKSIEIIGNQLSHNEGYLRWQWIRMMEHGKHSVVYVPTEANLPVLEAGKRAS